MTNSRVSSCTEIPKIKCKKIVKRSSAPLAPVQKDLGITESKTETWVQALWGMQSKKGKWGEGNWCRKKKELRQSCVWRWPCLQSSACTVQGDQRVTVWKVTQQQPKGGSGVSAALHCHPDHWAKILPMDVCGHPCVRAEHITVWPHPQCYSEAWRQKVRPYRVDLRSAWSAAPVGTSWHPTELDTAGIRDKRGPNLGNESQDLWHTHTNEKGQFSFHHFAILSPSF